MGVAPAELLMGRRLRFRLYLLKVGLAATVELSKLKQKLAHDGKQPLRVFSEGELVGTRFYSIQAEMDSGQYSENHRPSVLSCNAI